jgi:hypothetical protein
VTIVIKATTTRPVLVIVGTRGAPRTPVGSIRSGFGSDPGGVAMMNAVLVDRRTVGGGLAVTAVLIAIAIVLAQPLGGIAFLGVAIWGTVLALLAVGVLLIVRGRRPLAGAGTIVMAISVWTAFFVQPQAWLLWTVLFFVAVGLVVAGTRLDVANRSWLILLPRVAVGWALVDNSQDHLWGGWLPNGGGFLQAATTASTRQPLWPLDPAYQSFLANVVVPGGGTWAGLTASGELVFGVMLALGLLTPVGAIGAMWLNGNYMLMKGMVAHSAYTDKTFFAVELFCLLAAAGYAYGVDASLRRLVPRSLANLLGGPRETPEPDRPTPVHA